MRDNHDRESLLSERIIDVKMVSLLSQEFVDPVQREIRHRLENDLGNAEGSVESLLLVKENFLDVQVVQRRKFYGYLLVDMVGSEDEVVPLEVVYQDSLAIVLCWDFNGAEVSFWLRLI